MIDIEVSRRGARRWRSGHPWIYRSDVAREPREAGPGIARVSDPSGRPVGMALFSPASEIRLRMLTREHRAIDRDWWAAAVRSAAGRRAGIDATACRLVHAEADGLPGLVVDRYGPFLAVQILTAGLETAREELLAAVRETLSPEGIVLRHDVPVREREGLSREVETLGDVPDTVEIRAGGVRYLVELLRGQKTGSFLDQRENRRLAAGVARGSALDVFSYEGGFALHMAGPAEQVLAVDQSVRALERLEENATLNAIGNIETIAANAFDFLRETEAEGRRFDTIVLDPPAFAKRRGAVERALRGYKELNLRAMRLLSPGGHLLTFSCSYHVSASAFGGMLRDAAADAGRPMVRVMTLGAASDHPALLTVPETEYLKGALLVAADGV